MSLSPDLLPATDADVPALARLISTAFATPIETVPDWARAAGLQHFRVLRDGGGSPSACLLRIPMAQYFGGRSVPMVGIAGVAVAPEVRGSGHGRALLTQCVRELHREGVALSTLYPSTQALYRQVGYEAAGHRATIRVPIARIAGGRAAPGRAVKVLAPDDEPALRANYALMARAFPGMLDRSDYIWNRCRDLRGTKYQAFGFFDEHARLTGHVFVHQHREGNRPRHDLLLSDVVFTDEPSGRHILRFLSNYETTGEDVVLYGSPLHPLLSLLPQQRFHVAFKDAWMLRLTHVERALVARGYPLGLDLDVTIDLHDETVPAQSGAWRLRVRDGVGDASRAASSAVGAAPPRLHCDIRGLAAMYSGLYTPRQAALLGLCRGDDAAMDQVQAAFAQGTPWMTDFF